MIQTTDLTLERQRARRGVAMHALKKSILLNVVVPFCVYRLLVSRFPSGSLVPLALSGIPPIAVLAFGLIRRRTIDFIGFFAVEDIAVSLLSLLFAHSEASALVGRSMQNAVLGIFFLGSLLIGRPMVLYMARQLFAGNDPEGRRQFDLSAARPEVLKTYRILTWVWAGTMFVKSGGSVLLALSVSAQNYLILAPVWTYGSDALLVWWSLRYVSARLRGSADTGVAAQLANRS